MKRHIYISIILIMTAIFLILSGWQVQQANDRIRVIKDKTAQIDQLNKRIATITEGDILMLEQYEKIKADNLSLSVDIARCQTFIFKRGLSNQYGGGKPEAWDRESNI